LILPSAGASPVWSVSVAAIGSAQLWGAHIYQGLDLKEYIPTNGIESTEAVRVAHVSSDFTTIPQGPADSTYTVNKILGVP